MCVGPLVSTRMLSEKTAPIFAYASYIIGLILQSKHMVTIPVPTCFLNIALTVTLILVLIGEVFKVPVSLMYILSTSMMTYGLVTYGDPRLFYAVGYWAISSILILILSPLLLKMLHRLGRRRPTVTLSIYRLMSYVASFLLCMSFGANNIGYLWSLEGRDLPALGLIVIASMLGTFVTGRRTLRKLAGVYALTLTGCLTAMVFSYAAAQVATLLGIPVSFSVLLVCSIVGVSYGYSIRIIDTRYVKRALTVLYGSIPLSAILTMLILAIFRP
ncbi:MAG: hypothetical protein GXO23_06525 [Crenarchaeota archaeon]|nr:hypothetical protein [Thermoproteota archaeon]